MKTCRRLLALAFVSIPGIVMAGSNLFLDPVITGQTNVTDITNTGDSRLFIAEKDGRVLIFDSGIVLPTPFLDVSALTTGGFEQGLLGLAFHPDYANNGYVFINYTNADQKSVLARYTRSAGDPNQVDPTSGVILITVDHPNSSGHYGGQVAFGPDGYLYTSFGDGGTQQDPECDSQDTSSLLGTVIRIDVDQSVDTAPYYGIPADNPFVSAGHLPEVWGYGLRNPWRFDLDAQSNQLFLSDVGQFSREEVTVTSLSAGGGDNYGWKVMEGLSCFDPDPVDPDCPMNTPSCFDPAYTNPQIEYDHSAGECSVTGGVVYRGDGIAQLRGHYLFGDWCTGRLWSADVATGLQPEQLSISLAAVQAFGRDHLGEVYLTQGTTVFRLSIDDEIFADGFGG
ncbi:MAG: glucose dehydrogenase [Lysobacteraceae bacterium]|nr:MAG: glucose dehydrogenase [Xanthomonadaceae bacterium]